MTAVIPSITVGFDGSNDARNAARWAGSLAAERSGIAVHLVHALTLPPIPIPPPEIRVEELLARHEAESDALMERAAAGIRALGVEVTCFIRRWPPVDTLLEHARDRSASLLVVGQHGNRPSRLLLGSVSSAVARAAELPTVVVRGERTPSPPARVLLALDGSASASRAAITAALWCPRAALLAVNVREEGRDSSPEALLGALWAAGVARDRIELRFSPGPVGESLLALAEHEAVDLVVAGRRGQSAWRDLVLGGVSEKLLQLAPCPVLLSH